MHTQILQHISVVLFNYFNFANKLFEKGIYLNYIKSKKKFDDSFSDLK